MNNFKEEKSNKATDMSDYKKPKEIIFIQNWLRIDVWQSKKNIF